ncbi:IPTL-CTERM sorting domain-containing protein [Delftia tsuruhatensis]|uniref:IPTL-CTERM sorting domain-containing protein n=2 Tax=Delftia TaxID=80865 RepID=UPI001D0C2665|nr:IPTL-CTERM sorting domain-containing protein [Delftia acidovorans]MCX7508797.1 IPTL-CTERM sorting domain-containing protein [Delftia tsuruhatensis]
MKTLALRIAMLLLTAAASVSAGAVTVFDNLAAANDPWLIQHNSSYHTKLWVANRIPIGSQSLRITQVKMNLTQIDQFELQVCATDASAATPFVDMTACAPFTADAATPGMRVFTGDRIVAAGDFAWVVVRSIGQTMIRRQITTATNDGLTWYSGASHNPAWVAEPQTSIGMTVEAGSVQLDGVCGSASSTTPRRYPPDALLCSVGTTSGVMGETYSFSWVCQSSYGGNPSPQCSVPRAYLVTSQATGGGSIEAGRDVAAGQQASFTLTTPPGYTVQVSGCGGSLAGNTYTTATITGNCTISATFAPPPTNGACGSTAPSLTLPTLLCSAGSATNQSAASDAFRWNCAGISGGTTAACLAPRQYMVTVNTDAGIASAQCTPNPVTHGSSASCTATVHDPVARPFSGWGGACSGTGACQPVVLGATTVSANTTLITYAITTTATTGGSMSCTPNPVPHGQAAGCTATPQTGFQFTGWTGDCAGTGACQFTNVTSAHSVGATFAPITYAIATPAVTGGSVNCTANPVPHGQDTICVASPAMGYHFTHWSGDCAGTASACILYNVTSPRSVGATFVLNTYSIGIVPAPANGTVTCTPNPVTHGQDASCTATPDAGYHFTSWSGDCTGTGACQFTSVTASRTVSATFTPNTHSIATPAAVNGTVTCTPNPVTHGQDASCTATPNAGYHFTSWSGDCTGTGACQLTNVTSPRSVGATFALNTYPISIVPATTNGTVICTPNPVTHGQDASCTAMPDAGYHFTSWSGDCTGTRACQLTNVTSPRSVGATFALNTYSIGIVPAPANGTVTCAPNPVTHGQDASCTATPDTGYHFTSWSGDCTGTGACQLTNVTSPRSVGATFALNTYPISITPATTNGTVTCTPNPVTHGQDASCIATPGTGYHFTSWSGDCAGTGACQLTNVTSPRSVSATFTHDPVDATCGSAANGAVAFKPSANLCATGTPGTVLSAGGQHKWQCSGEYGGAAQQCSAPWQGAGGNGNLGAVEVDGANGWEISSAAFASTLPAPLPSHVRAVHAPLGLVLGRVAGNADAQVTVHFTTPVPQGAVYYKYGPSPDGLGCTGAACAQPHWYALPGAQFAPDGLSVTFTLADGGVGDSDSVPNQITDPGLPVLLAPQAIPALGPWALALLSLLAAGLVAVRCRAPSSGCAPPIRK